MSEKYAYLVSGPRHSLRHFKAAKREQTTYYSQAKF